MQHGNMKIITQLAVISVLVQDQDEALRFYTEKLGLEKRADVSFGPGMRWLTVAPKGQKRPEIALAKPDIVFHGEERTKELLGRIGQGTTGVFDTDDCWNMYETLCSRGVTFVHPPSKQKYGMEAVFEDLYGNRFALLEPSQEALSVLADAQIWTAA